MSLAINDERICGVYALGQWFEVVPRTFDIDSYELRSTNGKYTDWYQMGALYEGSQPEASCHSIDKFNYEKHIAPQGYHGVTFVDAETNERVYLSLVECRAFRCARD